MERAGKDTDFLVLPCRDMPISVVTQGDIHGRALMFMPLLKNIFNIDPCEDLMR